jgi:cytochrome c
MEESLVRPFAIAAALIMLPGMAAAQDLASGEASFKKCLPCHAIGPDARNKVGPVLNGLDGRKAATIEGYSYSDANRNSGIVWNEQTFIDYIKDPRGKVPGTKMTFAGIRNEQEAAALWAYLKRFDSSGQVAAKPQPK